MFVCLSNAALYAERMNPVPTKIMAAVEAKSITQRSQGPSIMPAKPSQCNVSAGTHKTNPMTALLLHSLAFFCCCLSSSEAMTAGSMPSSATVAGYPASVELRISDCGSRSEPMIVARPVVKATEAD